MQSFQGAGSDNIPTLSALRGTWRSSFKWKYVEKEENITQYAKNLEK
jgi:hypothetical protein